LKRQFVIMLILCTWAYCPLLHAQVYTTSSATYRSISNCGMLSQPNISAFRSTSAYTGRGSAVQESPSISYSTAPMRVANGTITTVASQLTGGVLADEDDSPTGYIPTRPKRVPGVPDTVPLNDGWDVAILLAILCLSYGIYLRRNATSNEAK
jgi:hypothetical protein